jgi:hypothetical protein
MKTNDLQRKKDECQETIINQNSSDENSARHHIKNASSMNSSARVKSDLKQTFGTGNH